MAKTIKKQASACFFVISYVHMKERQSRYQEIHEKNFETPPPRLQQESLPELVESGELKTYKGKSRKEFEEYIEALQGQEAKEGFQLACRFAEAVHESQGLALLVGGSVRDEVLGKASKDFDIEVYGLDAARVEEIASMFGKVDAIGKAFGILKVSGSDGIDLDISLPRTDSKIAEGHRGFEVKVDPNMSIIEAAKRRDFTFNALMKNPLTGEIFDPFNGVEDLRTRTLRITDSERFKDDPLRVMRAAQFIGRFGLTTDVKSLEEIQAMVPDLHELPKERFKEEWDKLLLKSDYPSMGMQALMQYGVINELYPELAAMSDTPQEFEWHPEGDVWVHTLMVVDEAARVARRHRLDTSQKRKVIYAALCHDLGKPDTTEFEGGRIRSKGHEPAGEEPTRSFLEKIGMDNQNNKCSRYISQRAFMARCYVSQYTKGRNSERWGV